MRNVITSPAQPSIESCVHANLTVFNCMSPRSVENIASQFTSEKLYTLFSAQEKKHSLLKIVQTVGMGVHFISQAKLPQVTAAQNTALSKPAMVLKVVWHW